MYLSRLTLNPRHAIVVRALSDLYAMHQLLWRGLPNQPKREPGEDRDGNPHPLLYRVESISRDGLARVLAQSESEPDWRVLSAVSGLLCDAEQKEYAPSVESGQWLRYRLRANPVVSRRKEAAEGKTRVSRQGLLTEDEQAQWLVRQGERLGFSLPIWEDHQGNGHPDVRIISPGIVTGFKERWKAGGVRDKPSVISLLCVDYEGLLRVTDPARLEPGLRRGVGPAKGLGFGLLSIAPVSF